MDGLLTYTGASRRDPRIEAWFTGITDPMRLMARPWFELMRACGPDVRELLHDGSPIACVGDAPFASVGAFKAHANVAFYYGAALPDPARLLQGDGKRMRHMKLRPGEPINTEALNDLIAAAYHDIRQRLGLPTTDTPMKTSTSAATKAKATASPSSLIDGRIKDLGDWRGTTLAHVRKIIKEAVPGVVEEWKWRGVPVWEHNGIITTGETYKDVVKLTFAKGASLKDPAKLFNSSLDGGTRRAIDIRQGEKINEKALKQLVVDAAALNAEKPAKKAPAKKAAKKK